MVSRHPYRLTWLIAGITVVIAAVAAAQAVPKQNASGDPLQDLLKQRRDTLRELVDYLEAAFRQGVGSAESVALASSELLDAELDMAQSKAERIAIREKMVENLKEQEKMVEARNQAGMSRPGEMLRARAGRLKAEIDLLREKGTQ
jgi:outer membrane protein TolC